MSRAPGRIRTCDLRYRKPALYPLSYGGLGEEQAISAHRGAHVLRHDGGVNGSWATNPKMLFAKSVTDRYSSATGSLVAAGVAYYIFFSLAPLAIGIGAVAGLFINAGQLRQEWDAVAQTRPEMLGALQPAVDALFTLAERSSSGTVTLTTVAALSVAIYAASKAVYSLRIALSSMHGQRAEAIGIVQRVVSAVGALIALSVIVGLVLVVTTLPSIFRFFGVDVSGLLTGLPYLDWIILVLVIAATVRLMLVHAPVQRVRISWRSPALWGATVWVIGVTGLLGLYTNWSSSVGAAITVFGAPIALLLWLYLVLIGLLYAAAVQAQITMKTTGVDQQSVP